MLYDLPMRKDAVRTEIVLETKRRFVRFVSHEIRTPLNTVNMGLTLFGLELDTIRDAVEKMGVGQVQVQGQGQSGATSLEAVQKFLLGKVDELNKIARDVTASTEEAVVVLNDLLNYDKVSDNPPAVTIHTDPVH
jgi:signal transduction histidine kinase